MATQDCFAEIKKSGIDGRGLFATKNIRAGSLIFKKTRPLVSALDFSRQDDTCANCFRSHQSEIFVHAGGSPQSFFEAKKCTGCRSVAYCSKTCQSQHWKRSHKTVCKVLKEAIATVVYLKDNPHTISNVTFALLEMVEMRDRLLLSEQDWISVLQLKSHAKEMKAKDAQRYETAEVIAERVSIHLQHPLDWPKDVLTQLACAILTNSLTLVAPTCDPLGLAFDPFACLANHSCEPNAYVIMNGPELSFRSLRDIAKDEEILVSYIDNTDAFRYRQAQLKKQYFFTCQCSLCKRGPNLSQDRFLTPTPEQQRKIKEGVEHVRKEVPDTIQSMRRRFGLEGGQLSYTDMIDCYARNDLMCAGEVDLPDVQRSEIYKKHALTKLQYLTVVLNQCKMSGLYEATRQPYATARNEYILECIARANFETAWLHAVKSYVDIDPVLYPEAHNPIRVVHSHRLAKLTAFLAHEEEELGQKLRKQCTDAGLDMPLLAWKCMKEAAMSVDKSHGADSPFSLLVKSAFKDAIDHAGDMVAQVESSLASLDPALSSIIQNLPY